MNRQKQQDAVLDFYDQHSRKLLLDYVYGNPRMDAAIQHALQWIPAHAKRILDVGCGIGSSTWAMKQAHPQAFVMGVDLSPKMIEVAQTLFQESGVSFIIQDLTKDDLDIGSDFDAIIMLDVYEHIPRQLQGRVHQTLNRALSPDGVVILTCPSLLHQDFLRTSDPGGLQPVDEDITINDFARLALDLNGSVIQYKHVNIWHTNDYVHVVIQRHPTFVKNHAPPSSPVVHPEPSRARAQRVATRLRVQVTPSGVMLPERGKPVVCVVSPNQNVYSETFIRAHIERLPATVRVLSGGWLPEYGNERPLLPISLPLHLAPAFAQKVLTMPRYRLKKAAVKRFLRKNRIDAVLAEYGPTGVALMETCQESGLPLIVHFHGFDAYHQPTLSEFGSQYPKLFKQAAAIIVVSREMEQELGRLGAPQEKLHYNPCGVDTDFFHGGEPAQAPPVFVAVGRFVDKKGPHLTLLAFRTLLETLPEARLIMIGDGPLWEACKQLSKTLGMDEAVEFPGPRSPLEVAATLRGARAFVQHSLKTSYGDSEGTPVAILEAGSTGLPVVATRHAGIADVIIEGETGFLVDEGDVKGMAQHMARVAEDPALAARLGHSARERVSSHFSLQDSIDNLWRVIETVLGSPLGRK